MLLKCRHKRSAHVTNFNQKIKIEWHDTIYTNKRISSLAGQVFCGKINKCLKI